ncbi:MAG: radical SAM protein [bacterium]|nr:radical SAM protein [bacterium]
MSIQIRSFMGRLGFNLRKYLPRLSSSLYIRLQSLQRSDTSRRFIEKALKESEENRLYPTYIAVETVNRCNGTCPFCPANINSETRPYRKMADELFEKILDEIAGWGKWDGVFSLYVNNEPFIDSRMVHMLREARRRLPYARMLVFTNGSLLTPEKLEAIADSVDLLIINNYSAKYRLNDPIQKIYDHVRAYPQRFKDIKIVIQKRYANEYLTNRAGTAPNKKRAIKGISLPCIVPYTDLTIYPTGQVGLCCSDVLETVNFGNVWEDSILDIYHCKEWKEIRRKMQSGRKNIGICSTCDFIDSGIRLEMIDRTMV